MKKINSAIMIMFLLALISCQEVNKEESAQAIKRVGSITGIKSDKIEYYKKLHAKAWPGVLKKLKECNIRNYSIYLQKIENKHYLFSYFEYTGVDFDKDMKKMAADRITKRWWKETDPTQNPLPEAASKKQVWTNMEEVFHTN
ncbi:L-rhamnose mutarotase [Flavobacterium sp. A45]|uniref:L-rhamnose mutarotase n=1 Tax=Flavobacterium sp. A45 TaxID=1945862 RepID=UPI0020C3C721|nr:L-rhamnose mutarotase [Flavobacterium sp. A45]